MRSLKGSLVGLIVGLSLGLDGAVLGACVGLFEQEEALGPVMGQWAFYFAIAGGAFGALLGGLAGAFAEKLFLRPPEEKPTETRPRA